MTIVYGYRHEEQAQARARYEQPERRESDADWFRRLERDAANSPERAAVREASAAEYARQTWRWLALELTGTDLRSAEFLIRAVYLGSPTERAQAGYDVRYAITTHGIAGTPAYLTRMATTLVAMPGHERRAAMLSAIAEAIDPANASDTVRGWQRRHWLGAHRPRGLHEQTTTQAWRGEDTSSAQVSRRRRRMRR